MIKKPKRDLRVKSIYDEAEASQDTVQSNFLPAP